MDIRVIDDHGTHLLVAQGDRFAIVERRNSRLYNCHDGQRRSVPLEAISEVATILDDRDWTDEATARETFGKLVGRGDELGESLR